MSRNMSSRRTRTSSPLAALACKYVRSGWDDCLAGQDFRREYDTWVVRDQLRYELGRRMAAVLVRAVRRVPEGGRARPYYEGVLSQPVYIPGRKRSVHPWSGFHQLCASESRLGLGGR